MLTRSELEEKLTLAGEDSRLEVHRGRLREKPSMSFDHNDVMMFLALQIGPQLDRSAYRVRVDSTRLRRTESTYYIPDFVVFPTHYGDPLRGRIGVLEIYDRPVNLVAEVWSVSTGDYDVDEKLSEYFARGDLEIWRLHPYERTLTAWRRQLDGTYQMTTYSGGQVAVESLPDVVVDLDELFDV